jgi:hypothetical protein
VNLKLALPAALVAGALIPVAALAGFPGNLANDHEATIEGDPTMRLGFDLQRVNGERSVTRFDAWNVPYSCYDGSTERVTVSFPDAALPIVDKRFSGKVKTSDSPPHALKVEGTISSTDHIRGTMSLHRRDAAVAANSCFSGILRWRYDHEDN